mmetsp:Transcript_39512/g.118605  ORF Transcript_39512/g.118605 Transcript_39512/m.118605 type:complete len:407 (-) Transcript_39512:42-1262(-)
MGILVAPDGAVTLPGLLFILGVPLIAIGQYKAMNDISSNYLLGKPIQFVIGTVAIAIGLAFLMFGLFIESRAGNHEDLKYELQSAEEILCELRSCASGRETDASTQREGRAASFNEVKCLDSLALKYGKEQAKKKRDAQSKGHGETHGGWPDMFRYKPHELELLCQEAAYIVFGLHPDDGLALSSALSLLALVAADDEVRRRNIEEADRFGLNIPVLSMRSSLARAKDDGDPSEEEERVSAELQRKGCLLLGALSNENKEIATKVVDEDGLIAVLDAINWFRYHEEIANWGLWAVFVLCYDHVGNKCELIKCGGVDRICRAMKDNPKSLEVARHGIASLFDLMREMPGGLHDVAQIRTIALNAGMHDVVRIAMDEFSESKEVMMMGTQILLATGYKGTIPPLDTVK